MITDMEPGRIYQSQVALSKTGYMVLEVLRSNHPEARLASEASLESYTGMPPVLVPLEITELTMIELSHWITGGSGTV